MAGHSAHIAKLQQKLTQSAQALRSNTSISFPSDVLCSCADRHALLGAILQRKEAFSRQALRAVLATELAGAL